MADNRQAVVFVVILAMVAVIVFVVASGAVPFGVALPFLALVAVAYLLKPDLVEFKEYERGVVFRFGKYDRIVGPGLSVFFPFIDKYQLVDVRTQTIDIPSQDVITLDNIKIKVDAIIYAKIADPAASVTQVQNFRQAIAVQVHAEIRDAVGKMALDDVVTHADQINARVQASLAETCKQWGIQIIKVDLESIELPPTLVDAMRKRKEANEYKVKVETEATAKNVSLGILDEAVSKMSDRTLAYLYLDALKKIADGKSNKIIFPLELSRLASMLSARMSGEHVPQIPGGGAKDVDLQKAAEKIVSSSPGQEPDYDVIVKKLLEAYSRNQAEVLDQETK